MANDEPIRTDGAELVGSGGSGGTGGGGGGGGDPDPAGIGIFFNDLADGDVKAWPFDIHGFAAWDGLKEDPAPGSLKVELNSQAIGVDKDPIVNQSFDWTGHVTTPQPRGQATLKARLPGTKANGDTVIGHKEVSITLVDLTLEIVSPTPDQPFRLNPAGTTIDLLVNDHWSFTDGVHGVSIVHAEWTLENQHGLLDKVPSGDLPNPQPWQAKVSVPGYLIGNRTLMVTGTSNLGGIYQVSVPINFKDYTPPVVRIDAVKAYQDGEPTPFAQILRPGTEISLRPAMRPTHDHPIRLRIEGTLIETQSGMSGGSANLAYSQDGTNYSSATSLGGPLPDWWFVIDTDELQPIEDYGTYNLFFRATDRDGNPSQLLHLSLVVSSRYAFRDLDERLTKVAYLQDLLRFINDHVLTDSVSGERATSGQLAEVFDQPFVQLAQSGSIDGTQPINELRVPLEVLDDYTGKHHLRGALATWKIIDAGRGPILDANPGGYAGTLMNSPTWVAAGGRQKQWALQFDSAQKQYVRIAGGERLVVDEAISICAWVKRLAPGIPAHFAVIFGKEAEFLLGHDDSGQIIWALNNTLPGWLWNTTGLVLPLNQWTHIALVYDGLVAKTYLDGVQRHTMAARGGIQHTTMAADVRIGGRQYDAQYFDGCIDDVRLYTFPVSPDVVADLARDVFRDRLEEGERQYALTAYEKLLLGLGVSYAELRQARGTSLDNRKSLARRLGIRLSDTASDELDQMTKEPGQVNEDQLELLFGLRKIGRPVGDLVPDPRILTWQIASLESSWHEDDLDSVVPKPYPVLIDPDWLGISDLADGDQNNPDSLAHQLLVHRSAELQGFYDILFDKAPPMTQDGFQALLNYVWGASLDLAKILDKTSKGEPTAGDLSSADLTTAMFNRLVGLKSLADNGSIISDEWVELYHLLVQVLKVRRYADWRVEESALSLSPDHFRIDDGYWPALPWRSDLRLRDSWQQALQARIDQRASREAAFWANVAAAEVSCLPLLRDARLAETAPGTDRQLSQQLLLPIDSSGSLQTTRVDQAIATLQGLIFSLRMERFSAGHPAAAWILIENEDGSNSFNEEDFDLEWQWVGSYAAWRAAMTTFLFPENKLDPALRPASTAAFDALVKNLRGQPQLTRAEARAQAQNYFEAVKTEWLQGGALASWSIDEGSGPTAGSMPGGYEGTLIYSPAWVAGRKDNKWALHFNSAQQQYVQIAGADRLVVNEAISICAWVKRLGPATPGYGGTIFSKEGEFILGYDPSGQIIWALHNTLPGWQWNPTGLELPFDQWTHIALVYDGLTAKIYLGGVQRHEMVARGGIKPAPGTEVRIGGRQNYTEYFDGCIDDVRLYTFPVSPNMIADLARDVYYDAVPDSLTTYAITEQRTNATLRQIRQDAKTLWDKFMADSPRRRALDEIFYFVPTLLALQLQQSQEYDAALDWFQTVYAYGLSDNVRKIAPLLQDESNQPPDLDRSDPHWARKWKNSHALATELDLNNPPKRKRPNAYTRYTLLCLAQCFADYADALFTIETTESIPRALALYTTASDLLGSPELDLLPARSTGEIALPNPEYETLRSHVETQLAKLRDGRNIANLKRQDFGTDSIKLSRSASQYAYKVLIERAKLLVNLAQQVEGSYLAAIERLKDQTIREYDLGQTISLAGLKVGLQNLRYQEAEIGVDLAKAQGKKTDFLATEYQSRISCGLTEDEREMINLHKSMVQLKQTINVFDGAIAAAQFAGGVNLFSVITSGGAAAVTAGVGIGAVTAKTIANGFLIDQESRLAQATILASNERREEEWWLQLGSAKQDQQIAAEQLSSAKKNVEIAQKEQLIAQAEQTQAVDNLNFLKGQFLNEEMYHWMSQVLAGVYRYFLQQAAAVARRAYSQLVFERQSPIPPVIQADYWEPVTTSTDQSGSQKITSRQGLTGSARLLQDIYQLDQYAFDTDRRKLNLSQTISLSQLDPLAFEQFRQTGILPFRTPMELFDRSFPGQFLRLIKRVRTTVVALIPPAQGIRATLSSNGISNAIASGRDGFSKVTLVREPQFVALSSPTAATGVFELDAQGDMLFPFEEMGVDTAWEFRLPPAANPFNYRTLGDVLITIEYTALYNADYAQQVIKQMSRDTSLERFISFQNDLPDQWYDLNNAQATSTPAPLSVKFKTAREDFPPSLEDSSLRIAHVALAIFFRGEKPDVTNLTKLISLTFATGTASASGVVDPNGEWICSTRLANGASSWSGMLVMSPVGEWELKLPSGGVDGSGHPILDMRPLFAAGQVEDIAFVLTVKGRLPSFGS